ncbi:hypothetical protein L3X38_009515 [Prunus dulcis]|uniref:Retrotransposon Copia-like N-terminal domain-containing protein n=1 Tax=Prunus dulcis TaxID=3755 RepID=A0AAD4WDT3_PRUDU|nr:hypothetical protein L3X38_009515 [Prunus dulcis]
MEREQSSKEDKNNEGKNNAVDPFFLYHSDHPRLVLDSKLLNGDNYSTWCRAMTISLNAKSKLGFRDGIIKMLPRAVQMIMLHEEDAII